MMRPQKALVIASIAGSGKSFFERSCRGGTYFGLPVLDLDTHPFNYDSKKRRLPPEVWQPIYANRIIEEAQKPSIVLISTHPGVLQQLRAHGIGITIAYPALGGKEEWLKRIVDRHPQKRKDKSYHNLDPNWFTFIQALDAIPESSNVKKVILGPGQYVSDIIAQCFATGQ